MSKAARKIASVAVGVVVIITVLMVASHYDDKQKQRDLQTYCDNVQAGYWSDYKGNAADACK